MRPLWQLSIVSLLIANHALAQAEQPLSAIDWLSESVESIPDSGSIETPTSSSAVSPRVTVTKLDGPQEQPIGLTTPQITQLPLSLWSESETQDLTRLVGSIANPELPALRELLTTLLVAQANAPQNQSAPNEFLLNRVDKLLDLGDLLQAQALLEAAGPDKPALFRRFFDVTLLTGRENVACQMMEARTSIAPTYPARIFCLARNGDWPAAALTLNTHKALGDITDEEDLLLGLFLDPEVAELHVNLPDPDRVSPLIYRMREAIGENLTTSTLPLAFAHADLRDPAGWKAQLEAAERLVRSGALAAEDLRVLYTSRRPSASGGVWDRARAIQKFENALIDEDTRDIERTLPVVWNAMKQVKAETVFADLYSSQLNALELDRGLQDLVDQIGLLSGNIDHDRFLDVLTAGTIGQLQPEKAKIRSVLAAFRSDQTLSEIDQNLSQKSMGEVLLYAIKLAENGMNGNLSSMTDSLSILRASGFEELARHAALQFLILEREL